MTEHDRHIFVHGENCDCQRCKPYKRPLQAAGLVLGFYGLVGYGIFRGIKWMTEN